MKKSVYAHPKVTVFDSRNVFCLADNYETEDDITGNRGGGGGLTRWPCA